MILFEDKKDKIVHIYKDDSTGNFYYFDGKKLVLLGNQASPTIGDTGNEQEEEEERKRHAEEVAKEREEDPEGTDEEESEEERQERLDRIKGMFDDDDIADEIESETSKKVASELKKIKASKEAEKYSSGIQRFQESLSRFIADQLKKIRQNSWKVSNPRYEGSGIMRRGKQRKEQKTIPLINVYFDQSSSWDESDIKIGEEAIGILNNYVKRGEIKIDVYFFANSIHDNAAAARREGGTGAGALLIEHIQATKPTNVIVMTDSDFDSWGDIESAPKISVPGAVWFLFKNYESQLLQEHLHGRSQTKKYMI